MNFHEKELLESVQIEQLWNTLSTIKFFRSCEKLFVVTKEGNSIRVSEQTAGDVFWVFKLPEHSIMYTGNNYPLTPTHYFQVNIFRKGRWIVDVFPTKVNKDFQDLPSEYW